MDDNRGLIMTEEMSFEDFSKLAVEKFGDKVHVGYIHIDDENIAKFNNEFHCNLTQKDFEDYGKHIWVGNKCPNCNNDLNGLFGCFNWGIIHGVGHCSSCNKTTFRYYHYIGDSKQPLGIFSLEGF